MTLHETIRGKINNSVKGKYWIQYQRFTFNGHKGKIKCNHRISMGRTLIVAVVQKSVEFKTVLLELLKNIPQSLYLVCAHLFVLLSIEPFDCGCIECRITASNQVHTVYKVFNGIRTSEMYTALWQTFKDWNFTSIFMAYSMSHFHHHESYSSSNIFLRDYSSVTMFAYEFGANECIDMNRWDKNESTCLCSIRCCYNQLSAYVRECAEICFHILNTQWETRLDMVHSPISQIASKATTKYMWVAWYVSSNWFWLFRLTFVNWIRTHRTYFSFPSESHAYICFAKSR